MLRQRAAQTFFSLLLFCLGLGFAPSAFAARGFQKNFVIVNANGSGNTFYDTFFATTNPDFNGANLGNFSNTTGSLVLNGAESQTSKTDGSNVTGVSIFYRVYRTGLTVTDVTNPYSSIVLPFFQNNSADGASPFLQTWKRDNAGVALVTAGMRPGNYTVEVFLRGTSNEGEFFDSNNGANYRATFNVTGFATAGTSTTWVGGTAGATNNWLNSLNWTAGIPDQRSDAIIPSPPRQFPPILNIKAADYSVRKLTIQISDPANAFTSRGILRITTATLKVYGDIENGGNGILATTDAPGSTVDPDAASAVIELAGSNQVIDRGRVANVVIRNNLVNALTGAITPNTVPAVKSILGEFNIPSSLTFEPGVKATLRSTGRNVDGTLFFTTQGDAFADLGPVGTIEGETNKAYVLGILRAFKREVVVGTQSTFGNIGIDINIKTASAANGLVDITRTTGTAFAPFRDANGVPLSGSARSIKRSFGISTNFLQTGLSADVVFHYNDSDTFDDGQNDELNTNRSGSLQIFRTTSGSTFTNLGGVNTTPDPRRSSATPVNGPGTLATPVVRGNGGIVTAFGLNNINTLTLADRELPLPITLVAFEARRTGNNALLTWTTATEKDNKGFFVEVSTDGRIFRSVGFVASNQSNSVSRQEYRFLDVTAGKKGIRYYRLRQQDLDGKVALSDVRVVRFEGNETAASTTLLAYPNPFTDRLSVSIAGAGTGAATLRLSDLAGRTVKSQQVQLEGTVNTLELANLSGLNAGIYMVQLVLPSGTVQNFKVQKQ